MQSKFMKVFSYVLVALLSCALTLTAVLLCNTEEDTKLSQLEELISEKFVEDADMEQVCDAAASAMVSSLGDRWSHYMTAQEYASYKEQMANAYVGIGVTVQLNADGLGVDVMAVTEGGPAQDAGVLYGDVITAVEGQSLEGKTLEEISALIKGEEGSSVSLTLLRGGETLSLSVKRMQIQTVVATGQMLSGNVGLVTIENFDSRCASETIAAVDALMEQGATSLIFDVRNNPGGYKDELVKILDHLLPEGLLFRSEYYDGTITDDTSDADCIDVPMVVLVNGNSYSAAEFFAAALRDYGVAEIVGEATCGKGYFQQTYKLVDGSAVTLSVGKYYTPSGVSLAGVGLTPDRVVTPDEETAAAIYAGVLDPMDDPQIRAALEILAGA